MPFGGMLSSKAGEEVSQCSWWLETGWASVPLPCWWEVNFPSHFTY